MKNRLIEDQLLAKEWPPAQALSARSIICLSGPTAGGKSAAALCLAQCLDAEIVCCDSMQVYRGLDIGTAKPSAEEQKLAPHHLLDICDVHEDFSVARYVELACAAFEAIIARGKRPLLVGGSALYLSALVEALDFPEIEAESDLRLQLQEELQAKGASALHAQLTELDPAYAAEVHPRNHKRLLRALELQLLTGKSRSERLAEQALRQTEARYDYRVFCLSHERAVLYERIERRVDQMLSEGLLDECRWLMEQNLPARSTCMQAIGYKEFFPYLEGRQTLAEATEQLKIDTRRYAKRQLSWFRAKSWPLWLFSPSAETATSRIRQYLFD